MQPPKDRHLYQQVYQDLKAQILSGAMPPNTRLPTESELAQKYGISVMTLRQAQTLLVNEGLLVKQQGRGTFVAPSLAQKLKILWISGADMSHGDVSAYYLDCLQFCQQECQAHDIQMEYAWLRNNDKHAAEPFCTDERLMQYAGFIFLGCHNQHTLVKEVKQRKLRHVFLGRITEAPHHVVINMPQAIRLGLERLSSAKTALTVMGLPAISSMVEEAQADFSGTLKLHLVPEQIGFGQVEISAYETARALIQDGTFTSQVLLLDDAVARGVTRAMLEAGMTADAGAHCCVVCGKQEMMPLGLPVTYIVHDSQREAQEAVRMVVHSIQNKNEKVGMFRSDFSVIEESA